MRLFHDMSWGHEMPWPMRALRGWSVAGRECQSVAASAFVFAACDPNHILGRYWYAGRFSRLGITGCSLACGEIMTTSPFVLEADLVIGLRVGDDDAAAYFVRQYTDRLLAVARRFLRNEDDAADAVQEAFLSAFKALEQFEGNSTLGTWMHRILVNIC